MSSTFAPMRPGAFRFRSEVYALLLLCLLPSCSAAAQDTKVWATPTGVKYHRQSCRTVGSSAFALSLTDAIERGLTPCAICDPPVPGGSGLYRVDLEGCGSPVDVDVRRLIPAQVSRVVDGDTVKLVLSPPVPSLLKPLETVRLLGIDAPESASSPRGEGYWGAEASAFATDALTGRRVFLAFDWDLRDRYGRLLAYLFLEDGTCFNLRLLEEGQAEAYLKYPFAFSEAFSAAASAAKRTGLGLWGREKAEF